MLFKNKKIAALVLCAAALMNLAGCSDTEAVPATETAAASVAEETTETTAAETTEQTEASETTAAEPEVTVVPLIADENGNLMSQYEEFELTSEDIEDGFWVDAISSSPAGDDVSPQLSWDPVDGAGQYIIYMVDVSANYLIHWKAEGVTETHLDRGWAESFYFGPYPRTGLTNTYDIYVIAIRNPIDRLRGSLRVPNENFPLFLAYLDIDAEGNTGNIIAYGHISAQYSVS
jgi:phosphatidylethanolamine-binding protein (PEBP) family uncharacterized protein